MTAGSMANQSAVKLCQSSTAPAAKAATAANLPVRSASCNEECPVRKATKATLHRAAVSQNVRSQSKAVKKGSIRNSPLKESGMFLRKGQRRQSVIKGSARAQQRKAPAGLKRAQSPVRQNTVPGKRRINTKLLEKRASKNSGILLMMRIKNLRTGKIPVLYWQVIFSC